jgi:DNA topoisomerase I
VPRRGGWRRLGSRRHFRYVDSHGMPVDGERLRRIEELAIPPAWRDVWISPYPGAKLQATGNDAAGRRQYLYHPEYRAAREQEKYDRLVRFGEQLPGLRRNLARHLAVGPYEREWACAVAVTLLNRAWFRVGSERHLRATKTYGITTLAKRHVTVRAQRVTFRFPGKHRVTVRTTLVDPELAEAVRDLLRFDGGTRLLRFEREGEPANLTARLLNEYIAENLGEGFTTKDFRTWGGTLAAARGLADRGLAAYPADERRILAAVMRRVGNELGNTPAVARASYVSPAVVEQWRDGRTLDDFTRRRAGGLSADETALLALLRSWRIRRARGSKPTKTRRGPA